jgi:cytochrome c6
MKKRYWVATTALVIFTLLCVGGCKEEQKQEQLSAVPAAVVVDREDTSPVRGDNDGQTLFQQHCAVCHPGGGNIIDPLKALDGETLAANGIATAGDIVATMRQPGPGMNRFDKNLLSDRDAGRIAEYILQSY